MRELRPGLCHWQARHPGWESSEPWDPNVSSYAIVEDERLLLLREGVAEGWRPLLELPVEHVLATHGGPFQPANLERALSVS